MTDRNPTNGPDSPLARWGRLFLMIGMTLFGLMLLFEIVSGLVRSLIHLLT